MKVNKNLKQSNKDFNEKLNEYLKQIDNLT